MVDALECSNQKTVVAGILQIYTLLVFTVGDSVDVVTNGVCACLAKMDTHVCNDGPADVTYH